MILFLSACELRFGATPTPTITPTEPPMPILTVVWATGGDLFAWREDDPTPRQIASGGVIRPFLAPDGGHVAFTRGSQGDAGSLWVVGADGVSEQMLVAPDTIPSIRNGHPQIGDVAWLDDQAIYFNTRQVYDWGTVNDDDLYRVEAGKAPSLILPPGAGGEFAISPDGQQIAVIRAGIYDTQKGSVALLDPLGVTVAEKLSFTALSAPSEAPFYPPITWSPDSAFVRVPIPDRESDRVALWRVPVAGEPQIFGYISAARAGLPVWSADQVIYWRYGETGTPELIIADANGENTEVYASGHITSLHWLPGGDVFAFDRDDAVWLGERGQPLQRLDIPSERVIFVGRDQFVYAVPDGLYVGDLNGTGAVRIASGADAAFFDAVVAGAVAAA